MRNIKLGSWNKIEVLAYFLITGFILIQALVTGDKALTVVSAICGITTTILTGKGVPTCYVTGFFGSFLYATLAFYNQLWGQMLLYVGYYVPMQIFGYIQWNKNLKKDDYEIVKTKLSRQEKITYAIVMAIGITVATSVLRYYNDINPFLDGTTTMLSILGVYLTVKRVIEQWYVWIIVNALSLIMWIHVALSGQHVWATVIMWAVYLFLGFYFFRQWKRELK